MPRTQRDFGNEKAFPSTFHNLLLALLEVYIGDTARTTAKRIKQHKSDSRNGHPELSAVANHMLDTRHEIYWHARVLHKESNTLRRKVHEALEILSYLKAIKMHELGPRNGDQQTLV